VVTLTSNDERQQLALDLELNDATAKRLILVDADGREYHFGCGAWTPNGTFNHVATYTDEGREPYAWWSDVGDGFERGMALREEPQLGPRVSPLVQVALDHLAFLCNQNNGFYGEPEKRWAVDTLRALWEDAQEPLDPREIEVWAATHGWSVKHAKTLREIVEGVRYGKQFRGVGGRAIRRDREGERKMVARWREERASA
jgi:hypothetical protein